MCKMSEGTKDYIVRTSGWNEAAPVSKNNIDHFVKTRKHKSVGLFE